MENLDGTIVTTAAPRIAHSLHVGPAEVGLLITAYLLSVAILIPLSGWMTQRYGARRVFLSAIGVFTVASLGCALCNTLPELVGMRVLQGVGGAMMVPVGRLVVLVDTEKSDLLRLIAYIAWPGLLAPVVAPLVGGVITTFASWRWLFLINIPLGGLAFAVAWRLVRTTAESSRRALDAVGVILTGAGLGGLVATAHFLSAPRINASAVVTIGLSSLVLSALAVRHLLRARAPLLNLRILRIPTLRCAIGSGSMSWLVIGATPFLLPLMFQTVLGWSPIKSGAVVLFVFVGNVGIKPATTPILRRFGFRTVLITSTLALAATMLALAFITAGTPVAVVAILSVLTGVARSVSLTAYSTIGLSEVSAEQLPDANVLTTTAQQLSAGFAIAAATMALRAGQSITHVASGSPSRGAPYMAAFMILALVAILASTTAARLHPHAGALVSKKATTQ